MQIQNPWTQAMVDFDFESVTQEQLETFANLMDDETREFIHADIAPCTPGEFLRAYCEKVGPKAAGTLILGS